LGRIGLVAAYGWLMLKPMHSGQAAQQHQGLSRILCQAFGLIFCAQWACAMLLFPLYKGIPAGYVAVALGIGLACCVWMPAVRHKLNEWLMAPSAVRFLIGICLIGLAVRLTAILFFPREPMVDDRTFHHYAQRMLNGEGYGDASARAFFPPGMSLLLTGWYWLTTPSPLSGKLLNALLGTLTILLTYDLGRRALTPQAARWAAVITALMPTLIVYGATLGYETALGCILLAVCDLALLASRPGRRGWLCAGGSGLLLGLGALVKPVCLLMPPLLGVAWLLLGAGRRAWAYSALSAGLTVVVIAPWTVRNYRVLGEIVPVSTNGGVVLYAANNPQATGLYMPVDPLPGEVDEVSRDRVRQRAALGWMVRSPLAWCKLAIHKMVYVWGTSSSIMSVVSWDRLPSWQESACKGVINIGWSALLASCVLATMHTGAWTSKALFPMVLLLAYVFVIHLFYEAMSRHHIPVMGALILVAAAAMSTTTAVRRLEG
jgi:hypothetical protein